MEIPNIPYNWLIAYWVFNAAIQALPKPIETSSLFYVFLYNFTHGLAGNVGLLGRRQDSSPTIRS